MTDPWAAPGSMTSQPTRPAQAAVAPVSPETREAALPPIPVAFRPMTVADVLDGAFEIAKRRPREVAIIAAVTILPLQMLATIIFRDVFASDAFSLNVDAGSLEQSDSTGPSLGATVLIYTLSALSLAWTCGAITVIVGDWFRGIRRSASAVLVHTLRRAPSLAAAVVLVKIAEFFGSFAIGIGALVAMAAFHVVSPVIALETANPFAAMIRSARLTGSQWWRSLVMPLLAGITGVVVSWVFGLLALFAAELMPDEHAWLVIGAGQLVTNLVIVPFTAGVAALFYFDLRIRREGLDIEERARAAFAR